MQGESIKISNDYFSTYNTPLMVKVANVNSVKIPIITS